MLKMSQLVLLITIAGLSACQNQSSASSILMAEKPPQITYTTSQLPDATVHLVTIPPGYKIVPVVSPQLNRIEEFAQQAQAKAVLNAGFFDPNNSQTTSYIIKDRQIIANPKTNQRLTGNPTLKSYLPQIFNRSEFRRYQCQHNPKSSIFYDIKLRDERVPNNCQLTDAIGAGPQLLPEYTAEKEAFIDPKNNRDALGTTQRNARTAIGIKPDSTVVWLMVAQNASGGGMTLAEVREFMQNQGVETALNLDGGSSSSLYFQNQSFYGKRDREGNPIKRSVKSVLVVYEKTE